MKSKISLLVLLTLTFANIWAQDTRTVTGTVTDSRDVPLPGAELKVVDKPTYTVTDFDGNFSLEVETGDVVNINYLGFQDFTLTITDQDSYNIVLEDQASELDEVVVVGYGTQKKRDLTGSIATVDAEEIQKTPTANVMQSMQGKVPGVQVISSGSPGASPTVRIRGLGTYDAGNANVLYVVDGAFYSNIDFLDTKDIKSINVLKDASSSAIYMVYGPQTALLSLRPSLVNEIKNR